MQTDTQISMHREQFEIKDAQYTGKEFSKYICEHFNELTRYAYKALVSNFGSKRASMDNAEELVSDVFIDIHEKENNLEIKYCNDETLSKDKIRNTLMSYINEISKNKRYMSGNFGYKTGTVVLSCQFVSNEDSDKEINTFEDVATYDDRNDIDYVETKAEYVGAVAACVEAFESKPRTMEFFEWLKAVMISTSECEHKLEEVLRKGYEDLFVNASFKENLRIVVHAISLGIEQEVYHV